MRAGVREAEEAAKDEVWAGYRFVTLSDMMLSEQLGVERQEPESE